MSHLEFETKFVAGLRGVFDMKQGQAKLLLMHVLRIKSCSLAERMFMGQPTVTHRCKAVRPSLFADLQFLVISVRDVWRPRTASS